MSAWRTPAKFIIVFTAVFLVSLGLCGLTMFTGFGDMQAGMVELLFMIASVVGVVITLIVALINAADEKRAKNSEEDAR